MDEHCFIVKVWGCSAEEAVRVMAERIAYDEDYGFPYRIDFQESTCNDTEITTAKSRSKQLN